MNFKIGDVVRVVNSGNAYTCSTDGSIGVVNWMGSNPGFIGVKFTYLAGQLPYDSLLSKPVFTIRTKYLQLVEEASEEYVNVSPLIRKIRQMETKWKNREAYA